MQRDVVSGEKLAWIEVISGVPHGHDGMVLGLLPFLAYIIDLFQNLIYEVFTFLLMTVLFTQITVKSSKTTFDL